MQSSLSIGRAPARALLCLLVAAAVAWTCIQPCAAQNVEQPAGRDKAQTSGLGTGAGIGYDNVQFGGHAVYYLQLPQPRWRVAFHVGAGVFSAPKPVPWGVHGGSFVAFGKRHRLILGVHGGTSDYRRYEFYGTYWKNRQTFAVGAALGYELMTEGGFYVRLSAGPTITFAPYTPLYGRSVGHGWDANFFSMGYKWW